MPLNWYYSMKNFLEWFGWFLTMKIDFENQILALFDGYFWPFNKSHEKIKSIFVISAIIPSIWNVFIKFHWCDEKLTSALFLYHSETETRYYWYGITKLQLGFSISIGAETTVKSWVVNHFVQRSQYISIKIPLHKQSENVKMCY